MITLATSLGRIIGLEEENSYVYKGIPFAHAERFHYATLVDSLGEEFDATKPGDACIQKRCYYPHLEVKERMFYHREFREGITFHYSEDCLNLTIYTPKEKGCYPVLVFIHGGGFDSGANSESGFDGDMFAKNGIVSVFLQYRVGVFGYFCHEDIQKEFSHDGNFGLDDQVKGLMWVKKHIAEFSGDPKKITLMGQSAGAMSIQTMLLSEKCKGLFSQAILLSGGGKFPFIARPKPVEERRDYWLEVMKECHCETLEEFRKIEPKKIFDALEIIKPKHKDNTISTMTMIDHYYLVEDQKVGFRKKSEIPTIISFTNNDMYTILLARMAIKYAKKNDCYCLYFDVDAKGDENKAFHSCDLRYVFHTLKSSWRPYDEKDEEISLMMVSYFSSFIKNGNPNWDRLPKWEKKKGKALRITQKKTRMSKPNYFSLLRNTFLGDPK